MSAAWVLVWLGASAPTPHQHLALESYELAHGLATRKPSSAARAASPYPRRVATQVEAALERARTLSGSLQDTEARAQVGHAQRMLRRHPELPQAAWQMAECLRLEAQLLARTTETKSAAEAALRAATILDGGRTLGVDEAALGGLDSQPPSPIEFRVEIPPGAELSVDGAASVTRISRLRLAPGLHHVRVTRHDRPLHAAWVELSAETPNLPLPINPSERCSEDEFAALRRAPTAGASLKSVGCERWLMARPLPGPTVGARVQVRRCSGSRCSAWVTWSPNLQLDYAGPAQEFDHEAGWPDWATYAIVGASALAITGVVLWQLGTFDSAEPGKKKWVYQAPAALSF
ncbi:MAG: hypothetical protein KC766_22840 [Myxococcales bacterium]|nr:hypothetical protein [Myxococcales bacterium]